MLPLLSRLAIGLPFVVIGCSGLSSRVEIQSTPGGAEVTTPEGEKLGITPLSLAGDTLHKATRSGRLNVVVSAPKHLPRELSLETHGEDRHDVKLTPLDDKYFSELTLKDYSSQLQEMARQLLNAQGLLLAKKLNDAETAIDSLKAKFPNLAAAYVLLANLDLLRGEPEKAKAHLKRARSLDKHDPVSARLLRQLEEESK